MLKYLFLTFLSKLMITELHTWLLTFHAFLTFAPSSKHRTQLDHLLHDQLGSLYDPMPHWSRTRESSCCFTIICTGKLYSLKRDGHGGVGEGLGLRCLTKRKLLRSFNTGNFSRGKVYHVWIDNESWASGYPVQRTKRIPKSARSGRSQASWSDEQRIHRTAGAKAAAKPRLPPQSIVSRRTGPEILRRSRPGVLDKKLVLESFGGFPAQLKLKCWCSSWMVCWAELCSVQPWSTQPYTGSNSGLCHGCFVKDIYVSNFFELN